MTQNLKTIKRSQRLSATVALAVTIGWVTTLAPGGAKAADVTPDRLLKPDSEPQNWLMVNKNYSAQRFSTLDQINRSNAANLKVAFTVALGGSEPGGDKAHGSMQGSPLVEDGFAYITDGWSNVYKVDVRAGNRGRIVWKADPGVDKSTVWLAANRGAALYKDMVISLTTDGRVLMINKETGRILVDQNVKVLKTDGFTLAPLVVKDKVIIGATGGDIGGRGWIGAFDLETKQMAWRWNAIPGPGEPGHETWKDDHEAWKTGGGAIWATGAYDPDTNRLYWGTGQPVPMFDAEFRPGDNLYTDSSVALDADTGKLQWYYQYTPNDQFDYDEVGAHVLYDAVIDGQNRKVLGHFGRNGFYYNLDRANGSFVNGGQYVKQLTWTKGLDPKTGKPLEYDPTKALQVYNPAAHHQRGGPAATVCPDLQGGVNFWPPAYSPITKLSYGASIEGCADIQADEKRMNGPFWNGGVPNHPRAMTGSLTAVDTSSGTVKAQHLEDAPNYAGVMATAGRLVFSGWLNGNFIAYDDTTLQPLYTFNVGTFISAPPVTYSVNGKQYVAVLVGGGRPYNIGLLKSNTDLATTELTSILYVFSL